MTTGGRAWAHRRPGLGSAAPSRPRRCVVLAGRWLPGWCSCARWVWSRSARPGKAGPGASRGFVWPGGGGGRGVPGCIRKSARRGGRGWCGLGRTGGQGGRSRGRRTVAGGFGSGAAAAPAAGRGRIPVGGWIRRCPAIAAARQRPRRRSLARAARAGRAPAGCSRGRPGGRGCRSRSGSSGCAGARPGLAPGRGSPGR